jgi:hypothetical protein
VTIPTTVVSIDIYAFYGCIGLTSVTIPNSVTTISSFAFFGCSGLTSITIPNSVTRIDTSAFSGCSGLTSVTIPNTVTTIGNSAFECDSSLTSISIPNSVTSISNYAFRNCSGLTSVTISNSVTSIGSESFNGCSGLSSVTIPNSVATIRDKAFYDCSGLAEIHSQAYVVPTLGSGAFGGVSSTIPVYVPCGRQVIYNSSWNYFSNFVETPEFTITVQSADTTMGTVSVTTQPTCADYSTIINATAYSGYRFSHWSDGATNNPRTIYLTQDTSITAYYSLLCSSSSSSDTVTVCDSYTWNGTTYRGASDSGTKIYSTRTSQGCDSVAYLYLTIREGFVLDVQSIDTTMGTVAITTRPTCADPAATITATANGGYRFVRWSDGDTENPRSFNMTQDTSVTAYFGIEVLIHDTAYIYIHDTTNNYIHDTTYINVPVHDTTIVTDTVTLTNTIYDTTYVNVPYVVHDTTIVTDTVTLTNTVYDTTYVNVPYAVHDTTIVTDTVTLTNTVYDTAYINVPYAVHDTSYITLMDTVTLTQYVPVHDTTTLTDTLLVATHDTIYLPIYTGTHDTIYLPMYVHDTTYITLMVHDTTTMTDTLRLVTRDTIYLPVYVHDTTMLHDTTLLHDTTYVNRYVSDTVFRWRTDTVFVNRYIHDTTYVNRYHYDTIYLTRNYHDTTYVTRYIHDTTFINNYVHDTTYLTRYDTITITIHDTVPVGQLNYYRLSVRSGNDQMGVGAGSGYFPVNTTVEIAAVPQYGFTFLRWLDGNTENPRRVVVESRDAIYTALFAVTNTPEGIDGNEDAWGYDVATSRDIITVRGAEGHNIKVYDMSGRVLASQRDAAEVQSFRVPATGTYLVQVDGLPAKKVVVIK